MQNRQSPIANRQSGNVLFLILIAVVLFAALSYAVSGSSRTNSGNISDEKADLVVSQLRNYSASLKTGFDRLRIGSCSLEEISFENSTFKNFNGTLASVTNSAAPPDGHCNIFDSRGGNVIPQIISDGIFKNAPSSCSSSTSALPGHSLIRLYPFKDQGTAANDVYLQIGGINNKICERINDTALGQKLIPTVSAATSPSYSGNNIDTALTADPGAEPLIVGKQEFCIKRPSYGPCSTGPDYEGNYFLIMLAR